MYSKVLFFLLLISINTKAQNIAFEQVSSFPSIPHFNNAQNGSVSFADIDNDNDQDVLITGSDVGTGTGSGSAKLYRNEGSGIFSEITGTPFQAVTYSSSAFADIDNDNDLDLLIIGYNQTPSIKLYKNDGAGNFTEAIGSSFDYLGAMLGSVAFADIDNDNDLDIFIIAAQNYPNRIAKLYQNDGTGNFTEVIGTVFEELIYSSVAFADIDNDNDQDVLITGLDIASQPASKLYRNDGFGNFTEVLGTSFIDVARSSIAFSDIDNDNDQDVLITGQDSANQPVSKLYKNDGAGNFSEVIGVPIINVSLSSITFSDIDNDNDQDLLITGQDNTNQSVSKLYLNDGAGNFTEVINMPLTGVKYSSSAFADIDNDNDALIIGQNNYSQPIALLYTNDGTGFLQEATGSVLTRIKNSSIVFSDVDNDSDQDLLITGLNNLDQGVTKLYENDAFGNFTEVSGTIFEGVYHSTAAFSDIDNDNDNDLLITGLNNSNIGVTKLYKNDGVGNFSEVSQNVLVDVHNGSIAFADIDNDNDEDLLITGLNNSNFSVTKLYLNDGNGSFTEVIGTQFINVSLSSIAFSDIDNDTFPDLLITGLDNSNTPLTKLYKNDGTGNFSEVSQSVLVDVHHGSIAFADIDNDNDQDLLITGSKFYNLGNNVTNLYKNDGAGNFHQATVTSFQGIGVRYSSINFSDLDNDNDQDVLITGNTTGTNLISIILENDGSGDFSEVYTLPNSARVNFSSVAFAHVNNDNKKDLIISGENNNGEVYIELFKNISSGSLSIEENTILNEIKIYPNPTSKLITIDFGRFTNSSIKIYTILGEMILEKKYINKKHFTLELKENIGMYLIVIEVQGIIHTFKLIKN